MIMPTDIPAPPVSSRPASIPCVRGLLEIVATPLAADPRGNEPGSLNPTTPGERLAKKRSRRRLKTPSDRPRWEFTPRSTHPIHIHEVLFQVNRQRIDKATGLPTKRRYAHAVGKRIGDTVICYGRSDARRYSSALKRALRWYCTVDHEDNEMMRPYSRYLTAAHRQTWGRALKTVTEPARFCRAGLTKRFLLRSSHHQKTANFNCTMKKIFQICGPHGNLWYYLPQPR
jgi:hypothetical protein